MEQIIKLTESDLHRIVKSVLNEISYSTVRSAVDKMDRLGQEERAMELSKTFGDVYNDDDVKYDAYNDALMMYDENDKAKRNFTLYGRGRDNSLTSKFYRDGRFDNSMDGNLFHPDVRTNSPVKAKKRAKHVNNFLGQETYNKNSFRK